MKGFFYLFFFKFPLSFLCTYRENVADSKEYVGLFKKKNHENSRKHGQDSLISSYSSMTPCITQHCVQESPEKDHIPQMVVGTLRSLQ